jgi:HD-like signal output (HDOD) protein
MPLDAKQAILQRLAGMERMPSLPIVLTPLLRYLEKPLEQLEVQQVVDLISQDKALVAQCIHMANSPLFGRWQTVDSVRGAVVALGMQRMRDIATSCCVLTLIPDGHSQMDPVVFWEHSLGCALVCRQFAHKIGYKDPGKAYLAGLLHDIGIVVHLWILPGEFRQALELARKEGIPLREAEMSVLGISHCESGRVLAEKWNFTPDVTEVISFHHDPALAAQNRELVSLVSLSDLLCRMAGLGHGFIERREVNLLDTPGFQLLLYECPRLNDFDWARFTFEFEGYLEEVHRLVNLLYRSR